MQEMFVLNNGIDYVAIQDCRVVIKRPKHNRSWVDSGPVLELGFDGHLYCTYIVALSDTEDMIVNVPLTNQNKPFSNQIQFKLPYIEFS